MEKIFNTTGACLPEKHYMVDIRERLEKIKKYIDRGEYFSINRARQYGKTTTLHALKAFLKQDYYVVSLDFQRFGEAKFRNENIFSIAFASVFLKAIENSGFGSQKPAADAVQSFKNVFLERKHEIELFELFESLEIFCAVSDKPIVLFIDEADFASNHPVFLDFLAQLRSCYLDREEIKTFQSVILAGVYDVRNLKRKIRKEDDERMNSPWNIAVPFDLDMSFSARDIATMLVSYEQDHQTGMDIEAVSEELYFYTGGYPFLVSCLCKKTDEEKRGWKVSDIRFTVRDLLKEKNTLFEDIIKNIQNNQEFSDLTEQIILFGAQVVYEIMNPVIELGSIFGIYMNKDGKTAVSNVIFETLMLNYFSSVRSTHGLISSEYINKSQYIQNGRLNMEYILKRFSSFLYSEYRNEDADFVERQGRLLFLSFLRPIINGVGHYAVEPQTRKNDRMDIQVFYGPDEFIVELKIWRGQKYEEQGYAQLVEYLKAREKTTGYLLSFCRNKKRPLEDRKFFYQGYEICEIIVVC